jgi:diguanylate cyclase (GGDEF)-like protein
MVAASVPLGVVGIQEAATLTAHQRKALGAAAGLMAIAVRNVELLLETREQSLRDGLTGCFNRGHGLETLDGELRRARRSRQPLSILMFDIDHFKTINDELGHLRGDDLLRAVGAKLTRVLRSSDVRCRYGGDEFLIILPDTPVIGAQQVAESLRREMAGLAMVAGDRTIPVTVSVGIAAAGPAELGVAAFIDRADDALYRAKRAGRDRYAVADGVADVVGSGSSAIGSPATVLRSS